MKFKKLTKEQLLISIDRLTRFKNPKDKYYRVFSDIITSCLIEPKYKKNDISNLNPIELRNISTEIINNSIDNDSGDFTINTKLEEYEKTIFVIDKNTEILINNKINYDGILSFITEDSPINLRWLRELKNNDNLLSLREKKALKYPVEKVLLVEGLTEEILLPVFAEKLDKNFNKNGIQIIPAGGKNQVVKTYYKLIEELKIPIFILLDKDAEENINQIKPKLRNIDKIHLVSCGEFEDLLPINLIIRTLNSLFSNFATISKKEFNPELSTVENLEEIFKKDGTCAFKKADFAKAIKENISDKEDISDEIRNIIEEISLDTKLCS